MIKTCNECAHRTEDRTFLQAQQGGAPEWICNHPEAQTRNLVTGICYCREERASRHTKACGKAGKLWTTSAPSTAG